MSALAELFGRSESEPPVTLALDLDELFHLLQNARRRAAIQYAGDRPPHTPIDLGHMAETIATEEYGPGFDHQERQRVYAALYQSHFSTLKDAGVIDYDDDRKSDVRVGPDADAVARVLERFEGVIGR